MRSDTTFSQKTLQLRTGPGTVYVVNADSGPHTFDIELNGRVLSYPVPARSTTAVVLDLGDGGLVHLLVRHSRSSIEHGRDAGGDPVMARAPDPTACAWSTRPCFASGRCGADEHLALVRTHRLAWTLINVGSLSRRLPSRHEATDDVAWDRDLA